MIEYRGHLIEYNPSPDYSKNWLWWEKAYFGPDDTRCGASGSFEAAKFDIDDHIAYRGQLESEQAIHEATRMQWML